MPQKPKGILARLDARMEELVNNVVICLALAIDRGIRKLPKLW